ncbi:MAG: hypothetical protein ABSD13_13095 [Candidatus Korobacteraceae bacterium]|jgi:nitrate/nitrite transporter NarK
MKRQRWARSEPSIPPRSTYLRKEAAAAGIALVSCLGALSGFAGPALMGFSKGRTGSFETAFHIISGLILIGAVLMIAIVPASALCVGIPEAVDHKKTLTQAQTAN